MEVEQQEQPNINNKKKEAAKRYNAKSYLKHKGESSTICEICGGKYLYYNKSHHNKSQRHLMCIELKNNQNK